MPIEIPREILKENPLYQMGIQEGLEKGKKKGLQEGRKKGLEEGRKKGLEEGRKKGLEEGRKKGLEEGRKEEALRILKRILKERFPSEFKATKYRSLKKLSLTSLEKLFTKAIKVQSLQEFEEFLKKELKTEQ